MGIVEQIYEEFQLTALVLDAAKEVSLKSSLDDIFRKTLILSAASYFEHALSRDVLEFVNECSHPSSLVPSLVRAKAINYQYHTWFDWKNSNNANTFFSLFGEKFKQFMKKKISEDEDLEKSIAAFMELGRDRNRLVHENYGAFTVEKTSDEIYDQYHSAEKFAFQVLVYLREFRKQEFDA